VEVTRTAAEPGAAPPPAAADLQPYSRQAMSAFATEQRYDFTVAGWTFVARPVRASKMSCLHCHDENGATYAPTRREPPSALRLGDALGAVLYAYRSAR
jgi:hypothetical protein